mmetsp:Transcript_57840/g.103266  ORF Transcript_57840/g.103266 Transcript_57840/m.103266 type:complete len:235 (-) Transcript_57840:253-957(-)
MYMKCYNEHGTNEGILEDGTRPVDDFMSDQFYPQSAPSSVDLPTASGHYLGHKYLACLPMAPTDHPGFYRVPKPQTTCHAQMGCPFMSSCNYHPFGCNSCQNLKNHPSADLSDRNSSCSSTFSDCSGSDCISSLHIGARVGLRGRPLIPQNVGVVVGVTADGKCIVKYPEVYDQHTYQYWPEELQRLPDEYPMIPAHLTPDLVPPRLGEQILVPPARKRRPRSIASPFFGWTDP